MKFCINLFSFTIFSLRSLIESMTVPAHSFERQTIEINMYKSIFNFAGVGANIKLTKCQTKYSKQTLDMQQITFNAHFCIS